MRMSYRSSLSVFFLHSKRTTSQRRTLGLSTTKRKTQTPFLRTLFHASSTKHTRRTVPFCTLKAYSKGKGAAFIICSSNLASSSYSLDGKDVGPLRCKNRRDLYRTTLYPRSLGGLASVRLSSIMPRLWMGPPTSQKIASSSSGCL